MNAKKPLQVSLSEPVSLYHPPSVSPCRFIFHQTIQIVVFKTFSLSFLSYHLLFNTLKHFMPCKVSLKITFIGINIVL